MKTKFIILVVIAAGVFADGAEKQLRFGKVVDTPAADQKFLNSQRALERQQLAAEAMKVSARQAVFADVLADLSAFGVNTSGITTPEQLVALAGSIRATLVSQLDAAEASTDPKALPKRLRLLVRALLNLWVWEHQK